MSVAKLQSALASINWTNNIGSFFSDATQAEKLAASNLRLAIWAKQLETADVGNPALSFVREMQAAGQYVAVLIPLSLYKPAAGSIRSVMESALYYTYFRTHLAELETLVRAKGYYIDKRDVVDFHRVHTADFGDVQQKLGVISRLEAWYGRVSSLVHGQIPGQWVEHKSVADIKPIKTTQDVAVATFVEGEEIVHRLFLCTTGRQLWDSFSSTAKAKLLAGLQGHEKVALKLDAA